MYREEMHYRKGRKEWHRWFHGKLYRVSCRQLGVREGQDESRQAANEYWEGIEAAYYNQKQNPAVIAAMAFNNASKLIPQEHIPFSIMNWLHAVPEYSEQYKRLIAQATFGREQASKIYPEGDIVELDTFKGDIDMSIELHLNSFIKAEQARCGAKATKATTFNLNRTCLKQFGEWYGLDKSVKNIDDKTVSGYFSFLVASKLSCSNRRTRFNLFQRFVQYLYESCLIELPRNLRNKLHRFGKDDIELVVWTKEEYQQELNTADDFTRCVLYLAANMGVYGGDMANLEWNGGNTITRYRTKTGKKGAKVCFHLWDKTVSALKISYKDLASAYSSELVDGQLKKIDKFGRISRKLIKPLKQLRHTSAQFLENSPVYRQYKDYFLGHAAVKMSDIHYSRPVAPVEIFEYLHQCYFGDAS